MGWRLQPYGTEPVTVRGVQPGMHSWRLRVDVVHHVMHYAMLYATLYAMHDVTHCAMHYLAAEPLGFDDGAELAEQVHVRLHAPVRARVGVRVRVRVRLSLHLHEAAK